MNDKQSFVAACRSKQVRVSALYLKQCLIVTVRRGSVALTHRNMEIRRLVHKVDVDLFGNAAKTRHKHKSAEL